MAKDIVYCCLDIQSGKSLTSILIRNGPFKKPRLLFIAAELVYAIREMHGLGYACGEINPDTVIVGTDGHITLMSPGFLAAPEHRVGSPRKISGSSRL